MNRRSFLKALVAVPFAGVKGKANFRFDDGPMHRPFDNEWHYPAGDLHKDAQIRLPYKALQHLNRQLRRSENKSLYTSKTS